MPTLNILAGSGNETGQTYFLNSTNFHEYLKLPKRLEHQSKHDFGHVVIVGGAEGMGGAVLMAGLAALKTGAGLVTIATHPNNAPFIFLHTPELMSFSIELNESFLNLLNKADVIVLGPGLAKTKWSKEVWDFCKNVNKTIIIDADGLNFLSGEKDKKFNAKNWILTPHPGEAARLLNTTTAKVSEDRLKACDDLVDLYNGIVVLKGHGTIVGVNCNSEKSSIRYIFDCGNVGMATPGMGDILTGIIASQIANSMSPIAATIAAVILHGLAGDSAKEHYGIKGILATELLPILQQLVNKYSV